jgi:hypothetical protein
VRQRGTKWWPGEGVGMGKDHTIFATAEGRVTFAKGFKGRTFISVLPARRPPSNAVSDTGFSKRGRRKQPALSHFRHAPCVRCRPRPPEALRPAGQDRDRFGGGPEPMKQETIVAKPVIEAPRMILRPMRRRMPG